MIDFNLGGFDDDLFGVDAFLDDDSDESQDKTYAVAKVKKFRRPRVLKYHMAEEAAKDVGKLEAGEHASMIVSGDFIAGDFFEAYAEEHDLEITEIIVSTLSMSIENVHSLQNLAQRITGKFGLIISDYFFAHERHDGVKVIIEELGEIDGFYFAVAGIHTKIAIMKTACGMNLVFGGSANLRSSMNIEQFTIDNDETLYKFHREWMSKIINDYRVRHKFLRRGPLWQLLDSQDQKAGAQ